MRTDSRLNEDKSAGLTSSCDWEYAKVSNAARNSDTNIIFAYGSLIWNPGFPFIKTRPAFVRGFLRRFWNKSGDHRGTVDQNGLVVCLVDLQDIHGTEPCEFTVSGVVYEVDSTILAEVIGTLDVREKYGYERRVTTCFSSLTYERIGECFVYCACFDPTIDVFLKPKNLFEQTPDELSLICECIATAQGPSGRNIEYLQKLKDSLDAIGLSDPHVNEVHSMCFNLKT